MTFTNQTNRVSATGSGSAGQEVPFSFPIKVSNDLTVYKLVTATGVQTTLAETTNYTIVINGDFGGTLTTVTAIETTEQIHIVGDPDFTQNLDLEQGGSFNAENIEDAHDKNTRLSIRNKDLLDNKAILFPATDAPGLTTILPSSVDRASLVIACDASGNITAIDAVPEGTVNFSTYGKTIVAAADTLAVKLIFALDHVFDARDYGGVADGASQAADSTAILAAIAAAEAVGGGTVYLHTGTWNFDNSSNPITLLGVDLNQPDEESSAVFKPIKLIGDGIERTKIVLGTTTNEGIHLEGSYNDISDLTIEGGAPAVRITGRDDEVTINAVATTNNTMHNVRLKEPQYGVELVECFHCTLTNVVVFDTQGSVQRGGGANSASCFAFVKGQNPSNNNTLILCRGHQDSDETGSNRGIWLAKASANTFISCDMSGFETGINISGGGASEPSLNNVFLGGFEERNTTPLVEEDPPDVAGTQFISFRWGSTGTYKNSSAHIGKTISRAETFETSDSTPTILGGNFFVTSEAATFTDFDNGFVGQEITIVADHTVTLTHGTNIFLRNKRSWKMFSGDTITLVQKADTFWYETGRSNNESAAIFDNIVCNENQTVCNENQVVVN